MKEFKEFTEADVVKTGQFERIYAERSELLYDPPDWMKMGLTQTATGYGSKLNSGLKIHFCGKLYRVYTTIFSNAGSSWFKSKGRKIFVS